MRPVILALSSLFLLFLAACSEGPSAESEQTVSTSEDAITIVSTVGMVGDLVREIGGNRVQSVTLIQPGVDPHLYKPTRSDVERLLDADAIFLNGLYLEGKMRETIDNAAETGRPVFAVSEKVDPALQIEEPGAEGAADPHLWMDPARWTAVAEVVRDALIELDADHTDEFNTRYEDLKTRLDELDAYAERVLSSVSESSRVLITAHDAFNYLGARFGYEVIGIQGISTESEAGVADIERLVSIIVDQQIPAIFVESTVSDRNISALIEGAKARGHEVIIGGELFSDAMGEAGTYEGTYIGMIDHNATTIARSLGGEAPERGLSDKLSENTPEE